MLRRVEPHGHLAVPVTEPGAEDPAAAPAPRPAETAISKTINRALLRPVTSSHGIRTPTGANFRGHQPGVTARGLGERYTTADYQMGFHQAAWTEVTSGASRAARCLFRQGKGGAPGAPAWDACPHPSRGEDHSACGCLSPASLPTSHSLCFQENEDEQICCNLLIASGFFPNSETSVTLKEFMHLMKGPERNGESRWTVATVDTRMQGRGQGPPDALRSACYRAREGDAKSQGETSVPEDLHQ
ncbi:uncharacterized protein LOC125109709 [Lutra lutra]|uniref:uncharacterized protein LOC125109709 n=1 Tax=Lutra lutra TaxID=9657 RepID=UPI001FD4A887|nr:uncharacterized protein LOC125109709 [Lutra lutra]